MAIFVCFGYYYHFWLFYFFYFFVLRVCVYVESYCSATGWLQYPTLLKALSGRLTGDRDSAEEALGLFPKDLTYKVGALIESLILAGVDYRTEMDKFDLMKNGTIEVNKFREVVLDTFRSGFTMTDLKTIERFFRSTKEKNSSTKINYVKFFADLHPHNVDKSGHIAGIMEELRQKIRNRCDYMVPGELRRPYRHFCRNNNSGLVNLEDFSFAMSYLGFKLSIDQVLIVGSSGRSSSNSS